MTQTKADNVCNVLSSVFSWWGTLPQMIVSDNGLPFNSDKYMQFLTRFNIVVKHTPVYHPESNGFAERSVQIVKKALKKVLDSKQVYDAMSISNVIYNFLLPYHNTPSTAPLKSPMELLLSFKTRTALSQCNPKMCTQNFLLVYSERGRGFMSNLIIFHLLKELWFDN